MQVEQLDTPGARLFRGRTHDGHVVEFLDASTPARRVFVLSTLVGCPVRCAVCDAGGGYKGRLTADELFAQVDALSQGLEPSSELAVELTRMGEPSFNPAVLDFLERLPARLAPTRVTALVSTVAPAGADDFFEALLHVKARAWPAGTLALQVSLFSSDETERRRVIPVKVWPFDAIAAYARRFVAPGERVTLNLPDAGLALDAARLAQTFPPDVFRVKLSALTATDASMRFPPGRPRDDAAFAVALQARGFEVDLETPAEAEEARCGAWLSSGLGPATPRRTFVR